MALTLIVVLIVLAVAIAAPELTRLRDYSWLKPWVGWLNERLGLNALWTHGSGLLLSVGLPCLGLLIIDALLGGALFGLLGVVIAAVVLFYTWGPRDLDLDVADLATATDEEARQRALRALGAAATQTSGVDRVELVFAEALRRWFGVLFWFVLFGPVAALGFRLVQLLSDRSELMGELPYAQSLASRRLYEALAWLPAQLMALALALAANFDAVSKAWREHHASHGQGIMHLDLSFLATTARTCIEFDDVDEVETPAQPRELVAEQSLQLVWRILIVWLAVLALVVLVQLLG
jgi:AmpE protein